MKLLLASLLITLASAPLLLGFQEDRDKSVDQNLKDTGKSTKAAAQKAGHEGTWCKKGRE
jgi:hypothetical protein